MYGILISVSLIWGSYIPDRPPFVGIWTLKPFPTSFCDGRTDRQMKTNLTVSTCQGLIRVRCCREAKRVSSEGVGGVRCNVLEDQPRLNTWPTHKTCSTVTHSTHPYFPQCGKEHQYQYSSSVMLALNAAYYTCWHECSVVSVQGAVEKLGWLWILRWLYHNCDQEDNTDWRTALGKLCKTDILDRTRVLYMQEIEHSTTQSVCYVYRQGKLLS